MRADPCLDPLIALKAPGVAGFFVRPKSEVAQALAKSVEHGDHLPHAHDQRLAALCKLSAQLSKAFGNKVPLPRRCVRQRPPPRFRNIERQDGAALGCFGEWFMVRRSQVAFEPDNL